MVRPDLEQMPVRIAEIERWGQTACTGFLSRFGIGTDGIECGTKGDAGSFDAREYVMKFRVGHREGVVFEPAGSPRSQLQKKIRTRSENGKRTIGPFQGETQDIPVEGNAGGQIVYLENDMVQFCHAIN